VRRVPQRERRWLLATGSITGLTGAVGLWLGTGLGANTVGLIWGAIAVPVAIYLLNAQAGRTTITADGIGGWRPLQRHWCPWASVSDITCKAKAGRGSTISYIVIYRVHGRAFKLPVPIASSTSGHAVFDEQVGLIRDRWNAAAWQALDEPPAGPVTA